MVGSPNPERFDPARRLPRFAEFLVRAMREEGIVAEEGAEPRFHAECVGENRAGARRSHSPSGRRWTVPHA